MGKNLDSVDVKIISELIENARLPAKELANRVDCHPNTMLQRLKKLESNGVIRKYCAQIDYEKMGYDLHVIIMVKVRKGRAGDHEQLKGLLAIKEIESLYATTGLWDLMGTIRVRNRKHLLDVLQKIGKNEIVMKTASHMVLFTYRDPQDFDPFE